MASGILVPYDPPRRPPDLSGLRCEVVHDRRLVRRLVAAWHSTHPARHGWKVSFLLRDRGRVVGVSIWGLPTARLEDNTGRTWEHYRMALSPEAPKNAASYFLARNREWIRASAPGVRRLISYIDETVHTGVRYRADNWLRVPCDPRGRPWRPVVGRLGRVLHRRSPALGRRAKFERAP